MTISVVDFDASGGSVPRKFPDGSTISLDETYFVSGYVDVWIPYSDLVDPVNENLGSYFLDVRNDFSVIDPISISGLSNYGVGVEDDVDNGINAAQSDDTPGNIYDRSFSFDGIDDLMSKTGSVKSYPGGYIYPYLQLSAAKQGTYGQCTKIDNTETTMTGRFLQSGSQEHFQRARQILDRSPFQSGFSLGADGIANTADDGLNFDLLFSNQEANSIGHNYALLYNSNITFAPLFKNIDDYNVRIEYSSVPVVDYQTDDCDDSVGVWVTDPE